MSSRLNVMFGMCNIFEFDFVDGAPIKAGANSKLAIFHRSRSEPTEIPSETELWV